MFGKMQECGPTEILPLICTSAIWGQNSVFSHSEFLGAHCRDWLPSDSCQMAGPLLPDCPQAHQLTIRGHCNCWWLWLLCLLRLLLSPCLPSLPHDRPMNLRDRRDVEARNVTLSGKLDDLEDGRLMSQNNCLVRVWMPGSFMDQRWREMRKQSKKAISSCKYLREWEA